MFTIHIGNFKLKQKFYVTLCFFGARQDYGYLHMKLVGSGSNKSSLKYYLVSPRHQLNRFKLPILRLTLRINQKHNSLLLPRLV